MSQCGLAVLWATLDPHCMRTFETWDITGESLPSKFAARLPHMCVSVCVSKGDALYLSVSVRTLSVDFSSRSAGVTKV